MENKKLNEVIQTIKEIKPEVLMSIRKCTKF